MEDDQGVREYVYLGNTQVAQRRWTAAAGWVTTWQHTDSLGSIVAETDASGAIVTRNAYAPYGEEYIAGGGPKVIDGTGYTGHVMDRLTGFTYMQQRYYDPVIGRFLSVDPVAASSNTGANFNRYWYGNNNPYKFTDPDGRLADKTAGRRIVNATTVRGPFGMSCGQNPQPHCFRRDIGLSQANASEATPAPERKSPLPLMLGGAAAGAEGLSVQTGYFASEISTKYSGVQGASKMAAEWSGYSKALGRLGTGISAPMAAAEFGYGAVEQDFSKMGHATFNLTTAALVARGVISGPVGLGITVIDLAASQATYTDANGTAHTGWSAVGAAFSASRGTHECGKPCW